MIELKRDLEKVSSDDGDMKRVVASIRDMTVAECQDTRHTFKQFLYMRYLYYMNACMSEAHLSVFFMLHKYAGRAGCSSPPPGKGNYMK